MKKLIFTLLLLVPIASFGQATLTLDADTNSVYVGAFEHPKNTLRAKYSDSGLAIIGTDNTTFAADRKYDTYINGATDSAFATFNALKAWVKENFFVDASAGSSSGGGDTVTLESVTTGTGNNVTPNAIQVTGFSNINLTLPSTAIFDQGAISGASGVIGAVEITDSIVSLGAATSSLTVRPQIGSDASVLISGRAQGQAGINSNDYTIFSQVNSIVSGRSFSDTAFIVTRTNGSDTLQLASIPMPVAKTYHVEVRLVSFSTDTSDEGATWHNAVAVRRSASGTPVILGSGMQTMHTPIKSSLYLLADVTVSISGNNLIISTVSGDAEFALWKAYISIVSL
jgi:hypothetical protein